MKIYRYMSYLEFLKMSFGLEIESSEKTSYLFKTNLKGLFFLGEKTKFNSTELGEQEFSPEECLAFLSGIVTQEVLVEFETTSEVELKQGEGTYADPYDFWWTHTQIDITEYAILKYNKRNIIPTRYILNPEIPRMEFSDEDFEEHTINENEWITYDENKVNPSIFAKLFKQNNTRKFDEIFEYSVMPDIQSIDKSDGFWWKEIVCESDQHNRRGLKLAYGTKDNIEKFSICFFSDSNEKEVIIVPNGDIPEIWRDLLDSKIGYSIETFGFFILKDDYIKDILKKDISKKEDNNSIKKPYQRLSLILEDDNSISYPYHIMSISLKENLAKYFMLSALYPKLMKNISLEFDDYHPCLIPGNGYVYPRPYFIEISNLKINELPLDRLYVKLDQNSNKRILFRDNSGKLINLQDIVQQFDKINNHNKEEKNLSLTQQLSKINEEITYEERKNAMQKLEFMCRESEINNDTPQISLDN